MGSFTFKWDKPAESVFVTGTFDEWKKSQQLDKVGDSFEKTVDLPDVSEKILYKFVVDNNWVIDESAPTESDGTGNHNNILTPDQIAKVPPPTTAMMSNVTPDATTAQLAAAVPLEEKKEVPTTTETVAEKAEADKAAEEEKPELSEKAATAEETTSEKVEEYKPDVPTPVAPGGYPDTPANDLDKPVGINPMPAADNAINPITLAPGEMIPDSVATEDVDKNVKLDKESYEKADELPGEVSAAQVPPISEQMIPESSLPITGANDVTISSAAPVATTASLAADAPIETKQQENPEVPDVVKESQEKAGVEPEASADPEEVKEKAEVEAELLDKVPEAPSAAEGTAGEETDKKEGETTGPDAGSAVTAATPAATTAAAAVAGEDAVAEEATGATTELPDSTKEAHPEAPAEVKEDIAEASTSPETTASTGPVAEKKDVEKAAPVEPKTEEAAKTEEAPTPAEAKPAEEVPKTEEAKPAEDTKAAVNGTEAPAAESSTAPSTTATAEKKRNRISAFVSKLKLKLRH